MMLFDKFVRQTTEIWQQYFSQLERSALEGNVESTGVMLYPKLILFTKCEGYYLYELLGASIKYEGLTVKRHTQNSVYAYFNQFDSGHSKPGFSLGAGGHAFESLTLAHPHDVEELKKRFPYVGMYGSVLIREGGEGSFFEFLENFDYCFIERCLLINSKESMFRCKNISSLFVCSNSVTRSRLDAYFNEHFSAVDGVLHARGVVTVKDSEAARLILAGQFQNVYLLGGLRETTIGEFIKLHPEIIIEALASVSFRYEPYLLWLEHDGSCADMAINPDLMVERGDGYFDICDLKTALLKKQNLTKGARRRRRFIDAVAEGVAQLANYREYFEYEKNKLHAYEKYKIKVKNPKLILVVGTWENITKEEVGQACRQSPDVNIIDYDTFLHMYLGVLNL